MNKDYLYLKEAVEYLNQIIPKTSRDRQIAHDKSNPYLLTDIKLIRMAQLGVINAEQIDNEYRFALQDLEALQEERQKLVDKYCKKRMRIDLIKASILLFIVVFLLFLMKHI